MERELPHKNRRYPPPLSAFQTPLQGGVWKGAHNSSGIGNYGNEIIPAVPNKSMYRQENATSILMSAQNSSQTRLVKLNAISNVRHDILRPKRTVYLK